MDERDLADEYITNVTLEFSDEERVAGGVGVTAVALVRACRDLLEARRKIQVLTRAILTSPGQTSEDAARAAHPSTVPSPLEEARAADRARAAWLSEADRKRAALDETAPHSETWDPHAPYREDIPDPEMKEHELPDTELPGMWTRSDFLGGYEAQYVNCPNCEEQTELYPNREYRIECQHCGYGERV